ncbi:unnamed protein product, partial [Darwinula stevensoni]
GPSVSRSLSRASDLTKTTHSGLSQVQVNELTFFPPGQKPPPHPDILPGTADEISPYAMFPIPVKDDPRRKAKWKQTASLPRKSAPELHPLATMHHEAQFTSRETLKLDECAPLRTGTGTGRPKSSYHRRPPAFAGDGRRPPAFDDDGESPEPDSEDSLPNTRHTPPAAPRPRDRKRESPGRPVSYQQHHYPRKARSRRSADPVGPVGPVGPVDSVDAADTVDRIKAQINASSRHQGTLTTNEFTISV